MRARNGYVQRTDGEWVHWARAGHLIACCDCGLVHLMVPRVKDGRVEVKATRMPKHTASRRTGLKQRAQHPGGGGIGC
jgi:hypothetical protein